MLGYSIYDKSINGIKTISDGKILISNGNINNCNSVNADIIDTNTHSCNELSLSKNNITIDTDEFLTLNNIDKTKTIQEQFNNINTVNTNLQTQITTNLNKNNEQDTRLTNIENKNTEQDNRLTIVESKNNEQDTSLFNVITVNNTQNSRLNVLESNVITSIVNDPPIFNLLNSDATGSVNLTITGAPNTRRLNFTFNIPRGLTGIQGINGNDGISFIWKGNWDTNNPNYNINDVVYWDGSSYICTVANNIDLNPAENLSYWAKMCEKGERGEKGSTGDSGLDSFLTALGLAGLIGGSALAILAGVLSISQNATDLQNGIDNLDQDLDNSNQRITQLENKTQNQTASVGTTRFKNTLKIENSLTLQDTITIDANNEVISCYTIIGDEINSNNNINCTNDITCANNVNTINLNTTNLNASGEINLGTSAVSSININSLNTNINGFLTINGMPYTPFNPLNFFNQWGN